MVPTKMGAIVQAQYRESLPNLTHDAIYITSEYDDSYNCIAWTFGIVDEWFEPGSLASVREDYLARGFTDLPTGSAGADVDLMGKSVYYVTHAFKRYTGQRVVGMPNDLWESKMSQGLRMTHARRDLVGNTYGDIIASFKAP